MTIFPSALLRSVTLGLNITALNKEEYILAAASESVYLHLEKILVSALLLIAEENSAFHKNVLYFSSKIKRI